MSASAQRFYARPGKNLDAPAATNMYKTYHDPLSPVDIPASSNTYRGVDKPAMPQSTNKSFAARAVARPDLSLDTSTDQPQSLPFAPNPQSQRRSSVPERSPLQKLEVTLGDMNKSEKRSRLEEAEHISRRRSERIDRRTSDSTRGPTSKRDSGISSIPISDATNKTNTAIPRSTSDAQRAQRRDDRRSAGMFDSMASYNRRSGYDAALTGSAAAAAMEVYQSQSRSQTISHPETNSFNAATRQTRDSLNQTQPLSPADAITQPQQQQSTTKPYPPRVAFADDNDNENQAFPHLFRLRRGPSRRYSSQKTLDEWQKADIARLTFQDLDLTSLPTDKTAWWENQQLPAANQRQRNAPSTTSRMREPIRQVADTTFRPALSLKCGPLLRYTGIRKSSEAQPAEFWRGSVMIVTEDAHSDTTTPPNLRLFKQPKILNNTAIQANATHFSGRADLIAGQPKCTPTGGKVYTNPVSRLKGGVDLSRVVGNDGLFMAMPDSGNELQSGEANKKNESQDGEKLGRYQEVKGHRLHVERSLTFWRFNIEIQLGQEQSRIAYRINNGPDIGFWVPAIGHAMNVMAHSCNGFSLKTNGNLFSGPDPLWRDVLNKHQTKPFHVMIGGGDQIYNDAVMEKTTLFKEWLSIKNPEHRHSAHFSPEMQNELEVFYLTRYSMWFSQGLFGMANSQIPMLNIWDDHDIIDGFGSYPDSFMDTPVFTGIGAVAFKYYMLFQHQSIPDEMETSEPSWVLGHSPGPYIKELSRSVFTSLGGEVAFLGLDCRTERMKGDVLSQETYDIVLDRLRRETAYNNVKHLILLLGIPIAYPRFNFLENILTSRAMDPIKSLARMGMFGGFLNKFDGGPEILDDLDDHWTAKHHKHERNWFVQELQEFAAEKSIRITILGGDVHLAAVGQFYSNKKLGIPKDQDHRYMPNVITSAIVNSPPPEMMANILHMREKVHHLDADTDESMIPMFTHDVDNKPRKNVHLLPRRNWCSISTYEGIASPPPSTYEPSIKDNSASGRRSFSLLRSRTNDGTAGSGGLMRRLTKRGGPPSSFQRADATSPYPGINTQNRRYSADAVVSGTNYESGDSISATQSMQKLQRPDTFHRRPSLLNDKALQNDRSGREGHINLAGGLEVTLHVEIDQKDPSGFTSPYRLIVPALFYHGAPDPNTTPLKGRLAAVMGSLKRSKSDKRQSMPDGVPYEQTQPHDTPPMSAPMRSLESHPIQEPLMTTNRSSSDQDTLPALSPQEDEATLDTLPRSAGANGIETNLAPPSHSNNPTNPLPMSPGLASATQRARSLRDKRAAAELGSGRRRPLSDIDPLLQHANPQPSNRRFSFEPAIPTSGLDPPLGRVNNSVANYSTPQTLSQPVGRSTSTSTSTNVPRPAEKDPYAHYADISSMASSWASSDAERTAPHQSPLTSHSTSRAPLSPPALHASKLERMYGEVPGPAPAQNFDAMNLSGQGPRRQMSAKAARQLGVGNGSRRSRGYDDEDAAPQRPGLGGFMRRLSGKWDGGRR